MDDKLEDCQFCWIAKLNAQPDWYMPPHNHDHHEMIFVRKGLLKVSIANSTYEIKPGYAIWYPVGESHEEWCMSSQGLESIFCAFDWPDALPPGQWMQHDKHGRMAMLCDWLLEESVHQHDENQTLNHAFFHALISEFNRLSQITEEPLVEQVRAYMSENLASEIALEDLAEVACLSKYHFLRRYKALSGYTPMEDLRLMRLQRARELILTSSAPMKKIARDAGLGDVYQLSRLFRQHFGCPPSALR